MLFRNLLESIRHSFMMGAVAEPDSTVVVVETQQVGKGIAAAETKNEPIIQTTLVTDLQPDPMKEDATKFLGRQAVQFQQFACFSWLIRFSVLEQVPSDASISYASLAEACGVPETQLKSVARMAMTSSLLQEPSSGFVAHSELSRQFVSRPDALAWAQYMTSASAPVAAQMGEQTARWGSTTTKSETAYNIAFDTNLSFFEHTKSSPERTKQFAGYMRAVTTSPGVHMCHLLNGFDWASLSDGTIIDVGGSSGHASIALAEAFPRLKFVVQDLASTLANVAPPAPPLGERITMQPHDFFEPQPQRTADVYLLRMILHDWPTEAAQRILGNIASAMKPGARIVVMDTLLPPPGRIDRETEALLRVRDLTMMQAFNAKEREWEEWEALVEGVAPTLYIKSYKIPEGSVMAVLEIMKREY